VVVVSDANSTPDGSVHALVVLPSVELIAAPCAILEVVAIAAGLFALGLSLLWLYMPSEAMWLLVGVLAVKRRRLLDQGFDVMLASRPRHCPKRRPSEVTRD